MILTLVLALQSAQAYPSEGCELAKSTGHDEVYAQFSSLLEAINDRFVAEEGLVRKPTANQQRLMRVTASVEADDKLGMADWFLELDPDTREPKGVVVHYYDNEVLGDELRPFYSTELSRQHTFEELNKAVTIADRDVAGGVTSVDVVKVSAKKAGSGNYELTLDYLEDAGLTMTWKGPKIQEDRKAYPFIVKKGSDGEWHAFAPGGKVFNGVHIQMYNEAPGQSGKEGLDTPKVLMYPHRP